MPTFVVVHIDILPYIRYHTHILFMTHYTTYPLVVLTINFPSISHKSPYTFNFDFYFSFPLYMTINTSVTYYNQLNRNPSAETTTSLHHYNYFHIIYTHPPPRFPHFPPCPSTTIDLSTLLNWFSLFFVSFFFPFHSFSVFVFVYNVNVRTRKWKPKSKKIKIDPLPNMKNKTKKHKNQLHIGNENKTNKNEPNQQKNWMWLCVFSRACK